MIILLKELKFLSVAIDALSETLIFDKNVTGTRPSKRDIPHNYKKITTWTNPTPIRH
jgi:hypothetical protein